MEREPCSSDNRAEEAPIAIEAVAVEDPADKPPKSRIKKRCICFAVVALILLGAGTAWGATGGFQQKTEPEPAAFAKSTSKGITTAAASSAATAPTDKNEMTERAEEAKPQAQDAAPMSTNAGDNGSNARTGDNAGSSSTQSSGGNSGSSAPNNGGSTGGNSNGGSATAPDPAPAPTTDPDPTPEPPAHQHDWAARTETVNHPAEYEQQWVSNMVYVPQYTCGTRGATSSTYEEATAHQEASGRGGCGAFYTSGSYQDQGSYQSVLIRDAWSETVTTGYACSSCGAWK